MLGVSSLRPVYTQLHEISRVPYDKQCLTLKSSIFRRLAEISFLVAEFSMRLPDGRSRKLYLPFHCTITEHISCEQTGIRRYYFNYNHHIRYFPTRKCYFSVLSFDTVSNDEEGEREGS